MVADSFHAAHIYRTTPVMKQVTKAIRYSAWKFQHGETCMGMIQDLCSRLPDYDHNLSISDSTLFYSLFTSIYVLYGRPFQQKGPFRLGESAVPRAKRSIHQSVVNLRNKMFAHIDLGEEAICDESGEELANMIINNTGANLYCLSSSLIPTNHGINQIKDLAADVRSYCQGQLASVMGANIGDANKLPVGKFKINLSEEELAPLLVSWSG